MEFLLGKRANGQLNCQTLLSMSAKDDFFFKQSASLDQ